MEMVMRPKRQKAIGQVALLAALACAPCARGLAAELRPSTVPPPIVVAPQESSANRVPDSAFYRDFARRAARLSAKDRAQLAQSLRNLAESSKASGNFAEAAHYYRLLDAVERR
jgi:hypothetical protein